MADRELVAAILTAGHVAQGRAKWRLDETKQGTVTSQAASLYFEQLDALHAENEKRRDPIQSW